MVLAGPVLMLGGDKDVSFLLLRISKNKKISFDVVTSKTDDFLRIQYFSKC